MKEIHAAIGNTLISNIRGQPGIDGTSLIDIAMEELEMNVSIPYAPDLMDAEAIFAVMDDLQREEIIWLDDFEDAWYIMGSPEYTTVCAERDAYIDD